MTNISNESNVVLPEELQRAIESARSNVTTLQAESNRLAIHMSGQQSDITKLHSEIVYSTERKETLEKDVSKLEDLKTELKLQTIEQQKEIEQAKIDSQKMLDDAKKILDEAHKKLDEADVKGSDLSKREEAVTESNVAIDKEFKKIENAKTILTQAAIQISNLNI